MTNLKIRYWKLDFNRGYSWINEVQKGESYDYRSLNSAKKEMLKYLRLQIKDIEENIKHIETIE